jgi:hypothetical protein
MPGGLSAWNLTTGWPMRLVPPRGLVSQGMILRDTGSDPEAPDYAYPEYLHNVLDPLDKGEGVACFLVVNNDKRFRTILYCSHKMIGKMEEISKDDRDFVRAEGLGYYVIVT